MEVELNTNNLRNLCRICLAEGDYNLWEHKVSWNVDAAMEYETMGAKPQDAEGITLREVLQMYNDWQHSILDLEDELQLICKICLEELQSHYHYYRRLQAANKQLKQLYEEALMREEYKPSVTEPMIIEQVVFENNIPEYIDIASEHLKPDEQPATTESEELYTEKTVKNQLGSRSTSKLAQKRKFAKNPKFILTGGVTQLLAHATGASSYAPILQDVGQQLSDAQIPCSPQKRKRTEEDVDVRLLIVEDNADNVFRENATEVIELEGGDDVYENNYKHKYEVGTNTVDDVTQEVPPNEILTSDYCEQGEQQIHEEPHNNNQQEVQLQPQQAQTDVIQQNQLEKPQKSENDDVAAVLPFSTLSADDAGRSIYVCKYCPQAFTAPCFLLTHARTSHLCKYCSKAFRKTSDLFAHIKEAHKDHKCSVCGKELSSNGNLRAHMKRMHRSKTPEQTAQTIAKYRTNTKLSIIKEGTDDRGDENCYIDDTSHSIMAAEYLD